MHVFKYLLVLTLLALATLVSFVVVVQHGFHGVGLLGTLGSFLFAALFFSYGLTMRNARRGASLS